MAAYRRIYDSRHLQADCQNRDQLRNPTLGNRVWATFTFNFYSEQETTEVDGKPVGGSLRPPEHACTDVRTHRRTDNPKT